MKIEPFEDMEIWKEARELSKLFTCYPPKGHLEKIIVFGIRYDLQLVR